MRRCWADEEKGNTNRDEDGYERDGVERGEVKTHK